MLTRNGSTSFSPIYLTFGGHPRSSVDIVFGPVDKNGDTEDYGMSDSSMTERNLLMIWCLPSCKEQRATRRYIMILGTGSSHQAR